jgi:hypothetical protein
LWSPQHHVSPLASSPGLSQDHVPIPPSSKFISLSELKSMPAHNTPPPDGSPQIASSPDDSYSSQSWVPTDSHSGSTSSWSSQHDIPPASSPGLSQDHVPYPPSSKFNSLSKLKSMPTHDTPPPDGSPQIASSPDDSYSSQSWVPTDSHSGSTSSWSSQHDIPPVSSPQDRVPFPPSSNLEPPSKLMSIHTPDTHPPPGPTDNRPPASPSDPGPSKEPNPPPSAKRPRPDGPDWSPLRKIFKGKFKRRFSDSGALNAAQGDLQGL